MSLRIADAPAPLKAFVALGLDLTWELGQEQATAAECPLCGKAEKKFSVNATEAKDAQKCRCWSCQFQGNLHTLIRAMYPACAAAATDADYEALAESRGLLDPDTLRHWGVVKNYLTGEWMVPAYGSGGELNQLYRYAEVSEGGRRTRKLLALPGVHHQVHRPVEVLNGRAKAAWVSEGPWDGMAFYEVMLRARRDDAGRLVRTGNRELSLLAEADVYASPGCNVWQPSWAELFAKKQTTFLYDSDHPRPNPKGQGAQPPAGYEGTRRAAEMLLGADEPPAELRYLRWGPAGYDPDQPSGTDVRDVLTRAGGSIKARMEAVEGLLARVSVIPADWGPTTRSAAAASRGGSEVALIPCSSWANLVKEWRKAMKWIPGLERALAFQLAVAASTKLPGDQLWGRLESPPSTGKSTLAEALSTSRKYVKSVSTLTGMTSGYQDDASGDTDFSLLAQCKDKTLIVKDADTLVSGANCRETMSQLRDVYDRVFRSVYKNKASRTYEQHDMTVVLCGTPGSLSGMDESDLGQRFLDCVIMSEIPPELETDVNARHINSIDHMLGVGGVAGGAGRDGESEAQDRAKRSTGGYLEKMRAEIRDRLHGLTPVDDDAKMLINDYGQFVSFTRGRPSRQPKEDVSKEMSTRLAGQIYKMSACVAAVTDRRGVDDSVLEAARRVALDTGRGYVLKVFDWMNAYGADGLNAAVLTGVLHRNKDYVSGLLHYLSEIKAVEHYQPSLPGGIRTERKWRMTDRMARLYRAVVGVDRAGPNDEET